MFWLFCQYHRTITSVKSSKKNLFSSSAHWLSRRPCAIWLKCSILGSSLTHGPLLLIFPYSHLLSCLLHTANKCKTPPLKKSTLKPKGKKAVLKTQRSCMRIIIFQKTFSVVYRLYRIIFLTETTNQKFQHYKGIQSVRPWKPYLNLTNTGCLSMLYVSTF